jgi:hypothetical protein
VLLCGVSFRLSLWERNAGDSDRTSALILADDVSDDSSNDGERRSVENCMEPKESDSDFAEDTAWDDHSCNTVDTVDISFFKVVALWNKEGIFP